MITSYKSTYRLLLILLHLLLVQFLRFCLSIQALIALKVGIKGFILRLLALHLELLLGKLRGSLGLFTTLASIRLSKSGKLRFTLSFTRIITFFASDDSSSLGLLLRLGLLCITLLLTITVLAHVSALCGDVNSSGGMGFVQAHLFFVCGELLLGPGLIDMGFLNVERRRVAVWDMY